MRQWQNEAYMLKKQIEQGIEADAVRIQTELVKLMSMRLDGYGNDVWMDDANVPNLLSCHGLVGVVWMMHGIRNTRNGFKQQNPFYYEGMAAKGIEVHIRLLAISGSIALSMQGLTSDDGK